MRHTFDYTFWKFPRPHHVCRTFENILERSRRMSGHFVGIYIFKTGFTAYMIYPTLITELKFRLNSPLANLTESGIILPSKLTRISKTMEFNLAGRSMIFSRCLRFPEDASSSGILQISVSAFSTASKEGDSGRRILLNISQRNKL